MAKLPGAIGPSYLTSDIQFDAQISHNLYLEYDELQTGVDQEPWRGILRFGKTNAIGSTTLPGAVRGSYVTSNNLCFFVAGANLYQLTGSGPPFSITEIGTLNTAVGPVDFADFGGLLCLVDGPFGYQYQFGEFTQITDPNFQGANTVVDFDGIFIFNVPNDIVFYYSGIDISAGLTFNGLDFDSKDGNSDPINGMLVFQRQLWVLGTQTGEIWVDNPGATNQWQRLEGPYLQSGCAAFKTFKYSELGGNNGPIGMFLGQSPRGGPIVYMTNNYTVVRISTHPIETYLAKYSQYISSATALLYQINGHVFYQINVPTMPSSLVYDLTTSQLSGKPCWTEFTYTDENNYESRDLADNHCYFNGYHLVGDYTNSNIYYLNPTDYTDNGSTILFKRRFPHIAEDYDIVWYNDVTLKIKTGQGLPCLDLPPGAPGGNGSCGTDPAVTTLTWTASTPGTYPLGGYTVWRSTAPTTGFTQIASVSATTYTYTDTTAVHGTTYYYYIKAFDINLTPSAASPTQSCASSAGAWTLEYTDPNTGNAGAFNVIVADNAGTYAYANGASQDVSSNNGGVTWTANNTYTNDGGESIQDMVFNGTYFIAIDQYQGFLYFSTDLETWTTNSFAYYANALYVDPTNQNVYLCPYTSSANVQLFRIPANSNVVTEVITAAPGPSLLQSVGVLTAGGVTVASGGYNSANWSMWYSLDDGITWSQSSTNFGANQIYSLANNGTIWLVTTYDGTNYGSWTSTDGQSWTNVYTTASPPPFYFPSMSFNGKFFTQQSGNIFSTTDGITWTTQTDGPGYVIGLKAGSGRMFAYGVNGIYESTDGNSFTITNVTTESINQIVSTPGQTLAIGSSNGSPPATIYKRTG